MGGTVIQYYLFSILREIIGTSTGQFTGMFDSGTSLNLIHFRMHLV